MFHLLTLIEGFGNSGERLDQERKEVAREWRKQHNEKLHNLQ
jgi:hypothetical protein